MPFSNLITLDIIETMEAFVERKRPPLEIRDKVDLGYKIEGKSIYIFEIRPRWNNPEIINKLPVAKATYVIAKKEWKVYWMRSNGKWYLYDPQLVIKDVAQFIKLVEEDAYHCFWG